MKPKQAKEELKKIMQQKTVSIPRLKRVLTVLDYELLEQRYINLGKNIKVLKNEITHLEGKLRRVFK